MPETVPQRFCTGDIIEVFVGSENRKFSLHKELVCEQSQFFEACSNVGFRESRSNKVYLSEDDADAFSLIVDVLYGYEPSFRGLEESIVLYCKAYILADKLLMRECQNVLMDALRCYSEEDFECSRAIDALELLEADLPHLLRLFLIDQVSFELRADVDWYLDKNAKTSKQMFVSGGTFLADVMFKYLANTKSTDLPQDPARLSGCQYHIHDNDKERKKCAEDS